MLSINLPYGAGAGASLSTVWVGSKLDVAMPDSFCGSAHDVPQGGRARGVRLVRVVDVGDRPGRMLLAAVRLGGARHVHAMQRLRWAGREHAGREEEG